jgi:hypothetical protein
MGRPGARRLLAFCHFTDDNTGVDVSAGLEKPAGFVCSKDPVGSKTLQDRMDRWNWLVNNQNPFCLCTVQILVQAFLSNSALAVHNTLHEGCAGDLCFFAGKRLAVTIPQTD